MSRQSYPPQAANGNGSHMDDKDDVPTKVYADGFSHDEVARAFMAAAGPRIEATHLMVDRLCGDFAAFKAETRDSVQKLSDKLDAILELLKSGSVT